MLTPAEEATEHYSNRFAGHILRYPQARALMTARRWGSNFLGPFDGGYNGIAKREFKSHASARSSGTTRSSTERRLSREVEHCTTDQVRFVRGTATASLMRLRGRPADRVLGGDARRRPVRVGDSSVGADYVTGRTARRSADRLGAYWRRRPGASTGRELDVATRRDALRPADPRASRSRIGCELDDRWLVVRGDLRTYRIHLGSGNILMEPADTYLCIVPAAAAPRRSSSCRSTTTRRCSVILSKAFLLARDTKITDRSIVAAAAR